MTRDEESIDGVHRHLSNAMLMLAACIADAEPGGDGALVDTARQLALAQQNLARSKWAAAGGRAGAVDGG